jgi:lambda family phage minor tail protein L
MSTARPPFYILSVAANLERHKLASGEPWVLLLQLQWPGSANPGATQQYIRLARNLDPVQFDAQDGQGVQTYTPFNFEMGDLAVSSTGQVPEMELKVSNVMRVLQSTIEQYQGVVGANLTLYAVNMANPSGEPDLTLAFTVKQTICDAKTVTFKLGASSPLRRLFPIHMYRPNYCIWQYKGLQCGYTGSSITGQTLAGSVFVFNLSDQLGVVVGTGVSGIGLPAGTTIQGVNAVLPVSCSTVAGSAVYTILPSNGTFNGVQLTLTAAQVASLLSGGMNVDLPGGGAGGNVTITAVGSSTFTVSSPASATSSLVGVAVEMVNVVLSAPATATGSGVALALVMSTCSHTLDGATGCQAHANTLRFGGFPGIDTNGAAVASVA